MTQDELEYCIRSATISVLLGHKMSELDRAADVRNDYRFLMSRKVGNEYRSYSVTYGTLLDQLAKDVVDVLGLSSMAFHEDYEYAPFDHRHDGVYDYTTVVPTFKQSDFAPDETIRHVCSVLTSNHAGSGVVAIPYPPRALTKGQPQPNPYIGEFRMHAGKHMYDKAAIRSDIRNGTFDGWVYADGGSYERYMGKYDFSEAYVHYKGSGTTFRVPRFQDFIRLNGTPDGIRQNGYGWVKYHNALKGHSHGLQTDTRKFVDKYVSATVEVDATHGNPKYLRDKNGEYVYKKKSNGEYKLDKNGEKIKKVDNTKTAGLHTNWYGNRQDYDYLREISADIRIADAKASLKIQEYSRDIESMPRHHVLPGMVYIGTKER